MRAALNVQRSEIQHATTFVEMQPEAMWKAHSKTSAISQDLFTQDYYEYSEDAEYAEGNARESQMPLICERSSLY